MKSFYKIYVLVFISSILLIPAFPLQDAYAVTTIVWRLSGGIVTGAPLNQGDAFGTDFVSVRVTDTDLGANGNSLETINVVLTGTTTGDSFTLTLTETGDSGVFDSGDIVLMNGNDRFLTSDTGTATIADANCSGVCDVGAIDTLVGVSGVEGMDIFSDEDGGTTPITLTLVETGLDTREFIASFDFVTSGTSSGSSLRVNPGSVITYIDNEDFEFNNGYILGGPANEGAISVVPPSDEVISAGEHVARATYNGVSADLDITDDFAGGRGSGGLIRPGLVVDSVAPSPTNTESSSGSGCSGDCTPPTVGVDSNLKRIVENGFSFNGNPVNAELYYTPYPLVTVNVGQQNKVELKIFDDAGFENIAHVGLGFGLGNGESFDKSRVTINLDMTRDGQNILSKVDPENVLENVAIITDKVPCNSTSSVLCLKVMIFHTFRAPLEFNMLATYIWDHSKNAWQNYYNHGIHIEGDSLNPPKEYSGIHKGHLIHLFETGKNMAIDSSGNTWTFDKTWKMDYIPLEKPIDGITQHGIDRNNAWFESYKKGQELLAEEKLDLMLDDLETEENSKHAPQTHYGDFYNSSENIQLQSDIKFQKLKAKYIFSQLYDVKHNFQK
ncbi:hypothetical protein [Nitrosopumilus adriaticus]|uniref:Uncharacterized protein n=1 Tax=Nitrosopumilus adriaticus TaxID=1580092 RepID=A0A0D5C284_9ARCH|nr:hypothetical protein [Nitrosopumilus adriaticus]AJW70688.1 conserved exported protein of unknown function [Nitrosopumilus adriaticus]